MDDHSHSAHEVGAAEDTHEHYASEVHGAATEDDVRWARREISSLRDSVRALQAGQDALRAKIAAEHELIEAVRQGAVTIPLIAGALRKRAAALARPAALARGQDPHDFNGELLLQRELCLLAIEIEE